MVAIIMCLYVMSYHSSWRIFHWQSGNKCGSNMMVFLHIMTSMSGTALMRCSTIIGLAGVGCTLDTSISWSHSDEFLSVEGDEMFCLWDPFRYWQRIGCSCCCSCNGHLWNSDIFECTRQSLVSKYHRCIEVNASNFNILKWNMAIFIKFYNKCNNNYLKVSGPGRFYEVPCYIDPILMLKRKSRLWIFNRL